MIYVGLDLSLVRTGYGIIGSTGQVNDWGVIAPKKINGPERLVFIRDSVLGMLPEGPLVICVEGYAMGAKGKVFHIGELGGVIRSALWERGDCAILSLPPTSLKMFATGHGGAPKDRMVEAANRAFQLTITDDNMADALHCASVSYAWHRPLDLLWRDRVANPVREQALSKVMVEHQSGIYPVSRMPRARRTVS